MDFAAINQFINRDTPTEPLSHEEEIQLITDFQNTGNVEARRRLIESNIRFVVKMALNYRNQGIPLADLIQEGNLGLIEALERFDLGKNCRLITYASWWIRLRLQRIIEQKSSQVKLPINKLDIFKKIKAFEKSFEMQRGRKPYTTEIARQLNLEEDKVIEINGHTLSFQTLHAGDEEHPGMETILEDDNHADPRDEVWLREAKKRLFSAMKVLSQREREVLIHRFDIHNNGKKKSLRKVGQLLGLSAEGVRRIEEQAMDKLRRPTIKAKMEAIFAA